MNRLNININRTFYSSSIRLLHSPPIRKRLRHHFISWNCRYRLIPILHLNRCQTYLSHLAVSIRRRHNNPVPYRHHFIDNQLDSGNKAQYCILKYQHQNCSKSTKPHQQTLWIFIQDDAKRNNKYNTIYKYFNYLHKHFNRTILRHRIAVIYPICPIQHGRYQKSNRQCTPNINHFIKQSAIHPTEQIRNNPNNNRHHQQSKIIKKTPVKHIIIPMSRGLSRQMDNHLG